MTDQNTNWKRMAFNGNKVWMEVDDQDRPLVQNGKVLIKYQLNQSHEYRVRPESVAPLEQLETQKKAKKKAAPKKTAGGPAGKKTAGKKSANNGKDDRAIIEAVKKSLPEDAIIVFTDGACSGNPGPAGLGVLMLYKEHEKSISTYLGEATNNIAELKAIHTALLEIKNKKLPVRIFTDSTYAMGVLTQGWKAKANQALIADIKKTITKFPDLKLIKVKGHAGVPENERADELATSAIKKATAV